ncbi:hypothetical protein SK128_008493 [Halocaridina rubra]|uniref:Uncharacterized protein n=1 Tax=Halocaridina rubra TaxID=373956 RepID=A0AAN8WSX5_HALRR
MVATIYGDSLARQGAHIWRELAFRAPDRSGWIQPDWLIYGPIVDHSQPIDDSIWMDPSRSVQWSQGHIAPCMGTLITTSALF